ncbi:MAG: hypothetical protein ABSG35_18925 [Syntrophobacteraceae bacterium]
MDISHLGSSFYNRIDSERAVSALEAAITGTSYDLGNSFTQHIKVVAPKKIQIARKRGKFRLRKYFDHVQNLLTKISHDDLETAVAYFQKQRAQDEKLFDEIYDRLADATQNSQMPGIALFLVLRRSSEVCLSDNKDKATFALFPGTQPTTKRVYMASRWNSIIQGMQNFPPIRESLSADAKEGIENFSIRILRSNRLWQRERWPKTEKEETFEATSDLDVIYYFNNIMLHKHPVDGWVDAFWGVQSGIRIPVPIGPDSDRSYLVILLTSNEPDTFAAWNKYLPEEISKPLPYQLPVRKDISDTIVQTFKVQFESELKGLEFAASLLRDLIANEIHVFETAMKLLSHAFSPKDPNPKWMNDFAGLINRIKDPLGAADVFDMLKHYRSLDRLHTHVLDELENWSHTLNKSSLSDQWINDLCKAKNTTLDAQNSSLLMDECSVYQFINYLKKCAFNTNSTIVEHNIPMPAHAWRINIHGFLLTAIADNLTQGRRRTSLTVSVKEGYLEIIVFYPNWDLTREEEELFLLSPIPRKCNEPTKPRLGFFLTANVLWSRGGTVQYYPLTENTGNKESYPAMIRLTIPLARGAR